MRIERPDAHAECKRLTESLKKFTAQMPSVEWTRRAANPSFKAE